MDDPERILFIKPSSLGDIVHAVPTFSALRARFPKAQITWLVKNEWADLLHRVEGLDRVWPLAGGAAGWLAQVPGLRKAQFDLAVDLQGLFRSGALARLARCPTRIGFANAREGSAWFYTDRVLVPHPDMHAVDRYLLVASALGATVSSRDATALRPSAPDREHVESLLRRRGIPKGQPWIAMVPSARWRTKRWPAGSFAEAADRLHQEGLGPVVLMGSPADEAVTGKVVSLMKTEAVDLAGACAIGMLPALLGEAAVLVTNDSGPMHVAAAVGTPVVALFGPTSPARTGPYGDVHQVLHHPVPCSPCFRRTCGNPLELECLRGISPLQVVDAVRRAVPGGPRP